MIVSNGFNIYLSKQEQVLQLYQTFYRGLKKGGVLITSFLMPPPSHNDRSLWCIENIDVGWLNKQKQWNVDVLNVSWPHFMTDTQFADILIAIGFKGIKIVWDSKKMFPTVIASKL